MRKILHKYKYDRIGKQTKQMRIFFTSSSIILLISIYLTLIFFNIYKKEYVAEINGLWLHKNRQIRMGRISPG